MVTITYTKDELINLINHQTIYLSDPLGKKEDNAANRLADVVPLTNDDRSFFDVALFDVGTKVFTKLAYDIDGIESPFIISGNEDPEYPDPLVIYRFNLYAGANALVVLPQVQQTIAEALINGILASWLQTKSYINQALIYAEKFEQSLTDIKSSLMYKQKASKTYRTL